MGDELLGIDALDCTVLSSIGMDTVSTSRVVIVMLCDQRRSRCGSALTPWTPTLAMVPPAVTMSSHRVNVAGMPIASIAVSTPRAPDRARADDGDRGAGLHLPVQHAALKARR
jgi:hypothetical protein